MRNYLTEGIGAKLVGSEGAIEKYELGTTGRGRSIELVEDPDSPPGTWFFGEGTVHHVAWDIDNEEAQLEQKVWLEGLGYTDVTEVKDRGYFKSIYNRTPGGALFEYAWTKPDGWTLDEDAEHLGEGMMIPPVFADQTDYILEYLEPLETATVSA